MKLIAYILGILFCFLGIIMLIAELIFVFCVSKSAFLWSKKAVSILWKKIKKQGSFIKGELHILMHRLIKFFAAMGVTLGEISKHGVRFILLMCIPVSLVLTIFCCTKNYRLQESEKLSIELDKLNLEIKIKEERLKHTTDSLMLMESKIANKKALDTLKSYSDKK